MQYCSSFSSFMSPFFLFWFWNWNVELPHIIYACFILHNFCELNNERISEDKVSSAIDYDREFQPSTTAHNYRTECNETDGKRIKKIPLNILILNDTTS